MVGHIPLEDGIWFAVSTFFGLVQAVVFSALVTAYYAQSRKIG
jgi:F0F1-type ATP synthase membrane subunit a